MLIYNQRLRVFLGNMIGLGFDYMESKDRDESAKILDKIVSHYYAGSALGIFEGIVSLDQFKKDIMNVRRRNLMDGLPLDFAYKEIDRALAKCMTNDALCAVVSKDDNEKPVQIMEEDEK